MIALLALGATAFAADRAPMYVDATGVLSVHPGMLLEWGSLAASPDVAIGIGRWNAAQSTGWYARVALLQVMKNEVGDGIGDMLGAPVESFRMMPVHAGLKWNLWPRPDWIQVDLHLYGSLSVGQHRMFANYDYVASQPVISIGAGAALELLLIKGKQAGVTTQLGWTAQPSIVASNNGMVAGGYVGLGGLEIGAGYVVFLGGPR